MKPQPGLFKNRLFVFGGLHPCAISGNCGYDFSAAVQNSGPIVLYDYGVLLYAHEAEEQ